MGYRVFEIRKRSSRFAYLTPTPEWLEANPPLIFDGRPKGSSWEAPPLYALHPMKEAWDISLFLGNSGLLLTERGLRSLEVFFKWGGVELLPTEHEGRHLSAVNILEVVNCLDEAGSSKRESGAIEKYSFHPKRFTRSLFKLPQTVMGSPYVAEDDQRPEWSFKRAVESAGLQGVEFHLLWESESNISERQSPSLLEHPVSTAPAPRNLKVLEAKPNSILLRWEHPAHDVDHFLVEWSRDGTKFTPVDEVELSSASGRGNQNTRSFEYREELPTSGISHYRVRAISEDGRRSEPSAIVPVSIVGPAAGDL